MINNSTGSIDTHGGDGGRAAGGAGGSPQLLKGVSANIGTNRLNVAAGAGGAGSSGDDGGGGGAGATDATATTGQNGSNGTAGRARIETCELTGSSSVASVVTGGFDFCSSGAYVNY